MEGKKKPLLMEFKSKGDDFVLDGVLKMCGKDIVVANIVKLLGIFIKNRPGKKQKCLSPAETKMVRKNKYCLKPPLGVDSDDVEGLVKMGYKSLSYRLMDASRDVTPKTSKLMVMGQFGGKLRYASSLYFCRATNNELNTVRFYYCMAMCSILKLEAIEVLGASCCKHQSVSAKNKKYRLLLDICELPSFKDMSVIDARSVIRQLLIIFSYWFVMKDPSIVTVTTRRKKKSMEKSAIQDMPFAVCKDMKGTILEELLILSKRNTVKELKIGTSDINYKIIWEKSINMCSDKKNKGQLERRLYADYMRHEFRCLDPVERRLRFRLDEGQLVRLDTDMCQLTPRLDWGSPCGPVKPTVRNLLCDNVQVVYFRDKCLVCSELGPKGGWENYSETLKGTRWDPTIVYDNWIMCKDECGFGAHKTCSEYLMKIRQHNGVSCDLFSCNDLLCQLRSIDMVQIDKAIADKSAFLEKKLEAKRKLLEKRKKNNIEPLQRYENDMSECGVCKKLVDLVSRNHLFTECMSLPGGTNIVLKNYSVNSFPLRYEGLDDKGVWDDQIIWDTLLEFNTKLKVRPRKNVGGLISNRCCTTGISMVNKKWTLCKNEPPSGK